MSRTAPDQQRQAILQSASAKLGADHSLYATEYSRSDEQLKTTGMLSLAMAAVDAAAKSTSKSISSGIPTNGWLIATPDGLSIMGRGFLGKVGPHKGTIPNKLLAQIGTTPHGSKCQLSILFVDGSEVGLLARTRQTVPLASIWAAGVNNAVQAAAHAIAQANQQFDPNQLMRSQGAH